MFGKDAEVYCFEKVRTGKGVTDWQVNRSGLSEAIELASLFR